MKAQYSVLGYRINLYFHDHKHAIEIGKNDHSHRNINHEIKRQKSIKQELGCEFISIDFNKENYIFSKLSYQLNI